MLGAEVMRRSCLLIVAAAVLVMLVRPANAAKALPGMGLGQHPFLYCGEWNLIHPDQTK